MRISWFLVAWYSRTWDRSNHGAPCSWCSASHPSSRKPASRGITSTFGTNARPVPRARHRCQRYTFRQDADSSHARDRLYNWGYGARLNLARFRQKRASTVRSPSICDTTSIALGTVERTSCGSLWRLPAHNLSIDTSRVVLLWVSSFTARAVTRSCTSKPSWLANEVFVLTAVPKVRIPLDSEQPRARTAPVTSKGHPNQNGSVHHRHKLGPEFISDLVESCHFVVDKTTAPSPSSPAAGRPDPLANPRKQYGTSGRPQVANMDRPTATLFVAGWRKVA